MRDYLENDIKISIALSDDPEATELFRRARLERERNQKAREEKSKQEIILRQGARRKEDKKVTIKFLLLSLVVSIAFLLLVFAYNLTHYGSIYYGGAA